MSTYNNFDAYVDEFLNDEESFVQFLVKQLHPSLLVCCAKHEYQLFFAAGSKVWYNACKLEPGNEYLVRASEMKRKGNKIELFGDIVFCFVVPPSQSISQALEASNSRKRTRNEAVPKIPKTRKQRKGTNPVLEHATILVDYYATSNLCKQPIDSMEKHKLVRMVKNLICLCYFGLQTGSEHVAFNLIPQVFAPNKTNASRCKPKSSNNAYVNASDQHGLSEAEQVYLTKKHDAMFRLFWLHPWKCLPRGGYQEWWSNQYEKAMKNPSTHQDFVFDISNDQQAICKQICQNDDMVKYHIQGIIRLVQTRTNPNKDIVHAGLSNAQIVSLVTAHMQGSEHDQFKSLFAKVKSKKFQNHAHIVDLLLYSNCSVGIFSRLAIRAYHQLEHQRQGNLAKQLVMVQQYDALLGFVLPSGYLCANLTFTGFKSYYGSFSGCNLCEDDEDDFEWDQDDDFEFGYFSKQREQ